MITRTLLLIAGILTTVSGNLHAQQTVIYGDGVNNVNILDSTGDITLSIDPGASATQSGAITGSGEVDVTGNPANSGLLTLTATNTYSGDTVINSATLLVSADENLGASSGNITLINGELLTTGIFSTSRAVTVGRISTDVGTIAATNGTTAGYSGSITVVGTLTVGNSTGPNDGSVTITGTTDTDGNGRTAVTAAANANLINNGSILGGNGSGGASVIGGDGGVGVVLSAGSSLINNGAISGGSCGISDVGVPGLGGWGVSMDAGVMLTNSGTISGGAGRVGVTGFSASGQGILGAGNDTVINFGTISGVALYSAVERVRADAIDFSNGGNTLVLEGGSQIIGNVVSSSGTLNGGDTLVLGGETDGSFDVSQIGAAAQYQGFANYVKIGSSTWTLTGTTTDMTSWTIDQGILSLSANANLGAAGGTITLSGTGGLLSAANLSNSCVIIAGTSVTDSVIMAAPDGTSANYIGSITVIGTLTLGNSTGPEDGSVTITGTTDINGDGRTVVTVATNANLINNGSILGGNGGDDRNGLGGQGGVGVGLSTGSNLTNNGTISGGNGGTAFLGNAGGGGMGVSMDAGVMLTNSGTISGGTGGGPPAFIGGPGGRGILGIGNDRVINFGTISGGLNGRGGGRADAIDFSNGGNTLVLGAGSQIIGNVVSSSGALNGGDTLALGGATDGSFDVSQIGAAAQYQGFTNYVKIGSSTWTLTGTTTDMTSWKIDQGILSLSADANLGAAGGTITLSGTSELLSAANLSNNCVIIAGTNVTDTVIMAAPDGTSANYIGSITVVGTLTLGNSTGPEDGLVTFGGNAGADSSSGPGSTGATAVTVAASGQLNNNGSILGGNGGNATGSGADRGGDGGTGVSLDIGADLINQGTISGGTGGGSSTGINGDGGTGVNLVMDTSLINYGSISGGAGGFGDSPLGGDGGTGVILGVGATLTNDGTLSGGSSTASNGGTGVIVVGDANFANNGTISGGTPILDGIGGTGMSLGAGANLTNGGLILGGSGGQGGNDNGGKGGFGVSLNAHATLINSGSILGGEGGHSSFLTGNGGTGGDGGSGASLNGASTLTNNSTISGGNGGGGISGGGAGGVGVVLGTGGTLINKYFITGGNGGTGSFLGVGGIGGTGVQTVQGSGLINRGGISGGDGSSGNTSIGGAGGTGVSLDRAVSFFTSGLITGGNGGASTSGGDGGVGVSLKNNASFNNTGTIAGGNGGMSTTGLLGAGGQAMVGVGNDKVFNSGAIFGGLSGDGRTRTDAIDFSGGGNTLVLEAGSRITGNVVSSSGTINGGDTLSLGGAVDSSFDVSQVGATSQYQGFTNYTKIDASTWTLTGSTTAVTSWSVEQGAIAVGSGASINGDISVKSGSSLGGGGTINGKVTVANGGSTYPGDPQILTVGSVEYQSGSTAQFAVDTASGSSHPPVPGLDYDQIKITGSGNALQIDTGTITLQLDFTSQSLAALQSDVADGIVDNYFLYTLGAGTSGGEFTDLTLTDGTTTYTEAIINGDATFADLGLDFRLSYTADELSDSMTGGNDLGFNVFAVPEPGDWAPMMVFLLGVAALLRRRAGGSAQHVKNHL